MADFASLLFLIFLIFTGIILILFFVYSILEKERTAVKRGIPALILYGFLLSAFSFIPANIYPVGAILPLLAGIILFPRYGNRQITFKTPEKPYDERDVMFSRNTLKPGTERFNAYYNMRPENKSSDDSFRKDPGLLSKESIFYNELIFNAAISSFTSVESLFPLVEGPAEKNKSELSENEIATFIKKWVIKLGALDAGFCQIQPYHKYSHIGRGEAYGEEAGLDHKYAIAFTVEMDHNTMRYNPKAPVVMESAQQYMNAGQIAVQLAQFLRNTGYEARAHIDANYRIICPIVAADAGLGSIGRMGLLMTPGLGPRVRIGVVTTNLHLPVTTKKTDASLIHFCEICKKCAINCPSKSIPLHSVKNELNPERWKINQETCFAYWTKVGTDCGRCMAVCPYSHPDNFIHNIIRWLIKRNPVNRWIALKLDDFFYGAKPESKKI